MTSPQPEHPETLSIGLTYETGESVQITPYNAALYTFYGEAAIYDHVYFELPDDLDPDLGDAMVIPLGEDVETSEGKAVSYVFRGESAFKELHRLMKEYDFPQVLYSRRVSEQDKDVYWAKQMQVIDDNGLDIDTTDT